MAMSRSRHPDKDIEKALAYAEDLGWIVTQGGSHAWGRMKCPFQGRQGCQTSVHSTPRVPFNHARHLTRIVDTCPHFPIEEDDGIKKGGDDHDEE